MSMIPLFKAALDADLSKSNLTMFLTLLMQTAGYGKTEDDLSSSRLEQLSGLRADRARAAARAVVSLGLFEAKGQGKYGKVYRIPQKFIETGAYIGFNVGKSETDAYEPYPESEASMDEESEATGIDWEMAYQELVTTNQILVKTNQELVTTNQILVKTNQELVSGLPKLGEQITKTRLDSTQILVTDMNKPLHDITTTNNLPSIPPKVVEEAGQEDGARTNCIEHENTPHALRYPQSLTAEEREIAPKKLDGLHPVLAQEVLDALAWTITHKDVRSNIGLLTYFANQARSGTFDRTPAMEWRKQQQLRQGILAKTNLTEINQLANEIKALQAIHRAAGVENPVLLEQIEKMKTDYFKKVANHEKQESVCNQM